MILLESARPRALTSKSLPVLTGDYAGGSTGDPKVILLVTFVDWAKKIVTNEWTPYGHRRGGRNSDVDLILSQKRKKIIFSQIESTFGFENCISTLKMPND